MAGLRASHRGIQQLPFSHIVRAPSALSQRRNASTETTGSGATPGALISDIELDAGEGSLREPSRVPRKLVPLKKNLNLMHAPGPSTPPFPVKYDRGPFHPIQPNPPHDPVARNFVPGPFNLPRLKQTYQTTIASDIMTMTYTHRPPGTPKEKVGQRLRGWDGSSPYHKNRPLRGPRGGTGDLPIVERDITFRNIPEIRAVTVAAYVPQSLKNSEILTTARAAVQSITGSIPITTNCNTNVPAWETRSGKRAGCKVTLYGNEAYEFIDKCVHLVFPKIKDWKGIKGSTGDSSGNLAWGFTPEEVIFFPEIEANYTMYPPKTIPGFRVFVETTATSDRQARLLFQSLGIPFYGKLVN